jgi:hypothetical protein
MNAAFAISQMHKGEIELKWNRLPQFAYVPTLSPRVHAKQLLLNRLVRSLPELDFLALPQSTMAGLLEERSASSFCNPLPLNPIEQSGIDPNDAPASTL